MGHTNTWIIYLLCDLVRQEGPSQKLFLSGNAWMLSGGLPGTAYSEKLEHCQFSKPA